MKAMVLNNTYDLNTNRKPLFMADVAIPEPGAHEVLVKIATCGVCHTELDEIEGRTPPPQFPIVLGHQVVGIVEKRGAQADQFDIGDRIGIAWIYSACGVCEFCRAGNENLCPEFKATGRDVHGGYAEFMIVPERFAFSIPDIFSDAQAAPLLCAGAIGYRSLILTNIEDGQNLGLTGFGASAHLVLRLAKHKFPRSKIYVFARSEQERVFAKELGAVWAGDTDQAAPEKLHAIIDTTPVWKPVVEALNNLKNNGRLVINAIRKESIDKDYLLNIEYHEHLWMEKEIKSVANVARSDVSAFLRLAAEIPIQPEFQEYSLADANQALIELKERKIRGAKVLHIG